MASNSLRPELEEDTYGIFSMSPRKMVLTRLRDSLTQCHALAHGKLHDGERRCAMGQLRMDCRTTKRGLVVDVDLSNQIARVNDSLGPQATGEERWGHVMAWVQKELEA